MKNYLELKNFLISYFGDYWEGKDKASIIKEAIHENKGEYIKSMQRMVSEFLEDNTYTAQQKFNFLSSTNIHFEDEKQSLEWLHDVKILLSSLK